MVGTPQPHDLLWLAPGAQMQRADGLPAWVATAWGGRAPVVVRRDASARWAGHIPVGLRGAQRHERCAVWVECSQVLRRLQPEDLARAQAWAQHPDLACIPALQTLACIAHELNQTGLAWGPVGGVGFALASGLPVLHGQSDLDVLVRASQPLSTHQRAQLMALEAKAVCQLDIQIDTGQGGFALAEWARGARQVLLKTNEGPVLVHHPWAQPVQGERP